MNDIENRLRGTQEVLWGRREKLHKTLEAIRNEIRGIDTQLADCAAAARVFDVPWATPATMLTVKDGVIGCLSDAGTEGASVRSMRPIIERELGRGLHQKTIGMTLYRMLQEGAVSRHGHRWWLAEFKPDAPSKQIGAENRGECLGPSSFAAERGNIGANLTAAELALDIPQAVEADRERLGISMEIDAEIADKLQIHHRGEE